MQIDISGPQGKGMKRSTLGVRRSKVKVIRGQDIFGGLAETLFSTSLGRAASLFFFYNFSYKYAQTLNTGVYLPESLNLVITRYYHLLVAQQLHTVEGQQ